MTSFLELLHHDSGHMQHCQHCVKKFVKNYHQRTVYAVKAYVLTHRLPKFKDVSDSLKKQWLAEFKRGANFNLAFIKLYC